MPRPAKPARLVWRDAMSKTKAGWYIEHRGKRIPTGCDKSEVVEAEGKFRDWLTGQKKPSRQKGRHPDDVTVADVIDVYGEEVAPTHAKPGETVSRLLVVNDAWGTKTLADINGKLCRDYIDGAKFKHAARRQLEDFRSAANYYHEEGYVTSAPKIVLPPKADPRHRWLTRSEAAALLWASWRMKQTYKGQPSDRRTGQHVARFALVGLYTGTRSAAICGAAVKPTERRGLVDLDAGMFFRRAEDAVETNKRQPPCRIPDRLLTHIRRWASTEVDIKTKFRGKSKTIGRMIAHDFVVEWQGRPVLSVKKAFKSACEAAGLGWYDDKGKFKTDVTPHTLRHTAATWLMQAGVSLTNAADYLGMTEATLRKHYYHHHPDFQAEAAEAITSKPAAAPKSNVIRFDRRKVA